MKTAQCPSCGAEVRFRAFSSVAAVCSFCRSTLIRKSDGVLENVGKMAEVTDDPSPIQINTEGVYRKAKFQVIGRLRYEYNAGKWNEWHIRFNDGRSGWLSDAMGSYSLLLVKSIKTNLLPAFDSLSARSTVTLADIPFTVTDIQNAVVVGGDGELPFKVEQGYTAKVVDLQTEDGRLATIDYSDEAPVLYVGESLEFKDLAMTHLRDGEFDLEKKKVGSREFKCKGCGAPLTNRTPNPVSIACGHCGTVTDFSESESQIIAKIDAANKDMNLLIPPGAKGKFGGTTFEIVGAIQREVEGYGRASRWTEYLLYNMKEGYRFLIEYNGHWNFAQVQSRVPKVTESAHPTAQFAGKAFKRYSSYKSVVVSALGEFYWRVKAGDVENVNDYLYEDLMLSNEFTSKEQAWSYTQYRTPEQIQEIFASALKSKLPAPVGIYPNQPSPFKGQVKSHFMWFILFAVLGLFVHIIFSAFSGNTVFKGINTLTDKKAATYEAFKIKETGPASVEIAVESSAAWVEADVVLVNAVTGVAARWADVRMSATPDDDDPPNTRKSHALATPVLAPGDYYVVVEGDIEPNSATPSTRVKVVEGGNPSFINYIIALLLMLVFPIIAFFRASAFETKRWADSDYAAGSDDDE